MRHKINLSFLVRAATFAALLFLINSAVYAQVSGGTDFNLGQRAGYESECAIAKNPTNKDQLFAACNSDTTGLFAARSTDGGLTWIYPDPADKTIGDGDAGQGPTAWCDPTLAWDTFGNLFITYINAAGTHVVTIISTDGGATFTDLASFGPASVDQPTVVAANTTDPTAPVAVWLVWNISGQMVARGAPVTGSGTVGAFTPLQTVPGTMGCSYGDIAIAPSGVVVQTCQNPTSGQGPATIFVNIDADGLGPGNFGAAITAATTNVGGLDFIPAQSSRSVDAEAGLAYDNNPLSPHLNRLYLVYTDEVVNESDNTDIVLRFSDDNGANWSAPITVSDDAMNRSQFMPKIAVNSDSGNIAICWHDARNSATNTSMQEFCSISNRDLFPAFLGSNVQIGDGSSTSSTDPNEFGDYSGLAYFMGRAHPIWGDTSNSGGLNPSGTANFDAYTDIVSGGATADEGDPHITTVNGIYYDFQSAGEFTVLRDGGLEIQTRQSPVSTASTLGPNGHTGLTTCVSLNTAMAARVGKHRVTYQPDLNGAADPGGFQLRVDGVLTTLGPDGLELGSGSRVSKVGDGIQIDFPDGTVLLVTPGFWNSIWYLNVNAHHTMAVLGVMGAVTPDTWLPRLPDRSSLGPKPAALSQRYTDLYKKFADAWRVTDKTSLFDYAPGTSTATFTIPGWPVENAQCVIPENPPAKPLDTQTAQGLCQEINDKNRQANCIFDVVVTGEPGFAKLYLQTERIQANLTTTFVSTDKARVKLREAVQVTAVVRRALTRGKDAPKGTVQFILDGKNVGKPVKLDAVGRANWKTTYLKLGKRKISARYIPAANSGFLASSDIEQ